MAMVCISCGKKIKISRECEGVGAKICSSCCGSKRNKEISCSAECKYYIVSIKNENSKEILTLANESFNEKHLDIYQDEEAVKKIVAPFEQFIFNNFYDSLYRNDDFFQCYSKIYLSLEQRDNIYEYSEFENTIKNKFYEIASESRLSLEIQKRVIIRMLKSIESMSGELLNNRGYLELLRGHFAGDGMLSPQMF